MAINAAHSVSLALLNPDKPFKYLESCMAHLNHWSAFSLTIATGQVSDNPE
jgi:hypothetical protein